jgi:hypothetical protein
MWYIILRGRLDRVWQRRTAVMYVSEYTLGLGVPFSCPFVDCILFGR